MFWRSSLTLVFVLALGFIFPNSSTGASYVTTRGREIVGPDGKELMLRGINLGNWMVPEGYMFGFTNATSPRMIQTVVAELIGPDEARRFWRQYEDTYITREDIQFIKKCGFNSVRIPFNYRYFTPENHPEIWLERGFELLDRAIGWCKEAGLWVVLDMHCAPGGQTGDNIDDSWGYPWLLRSEESQARTAAVWRRIAERYHKETIIAGYDLLNEPTAKHFDADNLNPALEGIYRRIVKEIRAVDKNHLVIIEGGEWASTLSMFGPPFDSNLVYSFHRYWTNPVQESIEQFVQFSEKHNVPLYMGESGENTDKWINDFRTLLDENRIGWCFWPYKKVRRSSCLVTIMYPPFWDEVMIYADKPRNTFELIRKARAEAPNARQALQGFLENSRLPKTRINPGYIKALGMQVPERH